MLSIFISNQRQHTRHRHASGPLILGRQPEGEEPHIVIDDDYVSRRHLRIDELPDGQIRVLNLGRNAVALGDGRKVASGQSSETRLPVRLSIVETVIDIRGDDEESQRGTAVLPDDGMSYESIRPSSSTTRELPVPLSLLGPTPQAPELARWFDTLLRVQKSAAGSDAFYQETAQALVELVGMDCGFVLWFDNGNWNRIAAEGQWSDAGPMFSTSILARVLEKKQTFFGNPKEVSLRASVARLEAVVASPILDASGEVVGVLYGSRDSDPTRPRLLIEPLEAEIVQLLANSVSAGWSRLTMEERLKRSETMAAVGQAISYIMHDLRGPMGNAQQLLAMLRSGDVSSLPREQQVELLEDSVNIALELLNDSLEFCRGGRVQLKIKHGPLRQLFEQHLNQLKLRLDSLGVDLQLNIPDDLLVSLDPDRMARVLLNLAKNAGEALKDRAHPVVTIGACHAGQNMLMWVADNGPGLPAQVQQNLFQPFSTHGKQGGTGFGLAIAKQLVEAHKGRIEVASSPQGTRFTIEIPRADISGPAPAAQQPAKQVTAQSNAGGEPVSAGASAAGRPLRILLAEDGQMNQRLIAGLLRNQGHDVVIAGDGKQAVQLWEQHQASRRFDLILMDVEMPQLSGLDAARLIRQREDGQRSTPILALTAHESDDVQQSCDQCQMDGLFVKPLRPEDVQRILQMLPRDESS